MSLSFRADIEGLRAVAILLVVCAHANVSWLAGGFVGVDVFFVLSGYLITGLLVRELEANGRLDLETFYARRLQRLLPNLLLVVAITSIGAAFLLAPLEQLNQAPAAGAAATWTSNFYFAFARLDYFGSAADSNLFLHTWSLGVEEQFYLVWPALILFLLGAWKWQGQGYNTARLKHGLMVVVALCLMLSILLTYAKPHWGFYMVVSRGWQFALGGLTFLWLGGNTLVGKAAWTAKLAQWVGLGAIAASALVLDKNTAYPGYWALLPSLGTACVLASGATGLLSWGPMLAIGRISYAWYLWHWPVMLLGRTVVDVNDWINVTTLMLVSLLLAAASYVAVESPLRRSPALRRHPRYLIAASVLVMLVALAGSNTWASLAERWARNPDQLKLLNVRSDLPSIYAMGCDEWFYTSRVRVCAFGEENAPNTAVLMGDSIAGQWFPAAAGYFNRPGWRLLVLTKSACPMVDIPLFYPRIGREYIECAQWRDSAIALLQSIKPQVVLFSSVSTYNFSSEQWRSGTERVLSRLVIASPHIGILMPTPILPFDGPTCLARKHWRDRFGSPGGSCDANRGRRPNLTAALIQAANDHSGVSLINLDDAICPDGRCMAERDGLPIYRDNQHLTADFSATLATDLGHALERAGLVQESGEREMLLPAMPSKRRK